MARGSEVKFNILCFYLVILFSMGKRVKGIIINVSSVCAGGNAGQSAYSASKAGLEAVESLGKELGPIGIGSVAVHQALLRVKVL